MEELLQVVLKGGPRQQQLVIDLVAVQDPKELGEGGQGACQGAPGGRPIWEAPEPAVSTSYLGLVVLEPVGLIHHKAGPLDGAQDGLVDGDELVGGEQDVEFDLHFFLEGKGGVWEESWESSRSRSPETKGRGGVWTGPPESPGSPGTERKTHATERRGQLRPRAPSPRERGRAERGRGEPVGGTCVCTGPALLS